jgi:hypothetical protein
MSKENQNVDQSENCRLRVPEKFCKEQGDATFVNGTTIFPSLALPANSIFPQSSQAKFLSEEHEKANTMPPIRRPFTRTYQPCYSPYSPLNTDFYSLQASILDSIRDISAFTMKHQDIQIDSSNIMRAIRLLAQCETALETTETGLQIALPGSKFQYYRPVFKDFEDTLQRLKTRLLSFTNVSDEIRQMALNQLDDSIPPPPPDSPPLSPSSPAYSPVYWSPSTNDDDDSPDENDTTSDSDEADDDESSIIQ